MSLDLDGLGAMRLDEAYIHNWYIRQRYWPSARLALSDYRVHIWYIVSWNLDNIFHQHLKDKNAFKMSSSKYRPFGSGLILSYAWRELYTWPINKQSIQRNCLTSQNISLNVQLTITFQRRLLGGKVSKFNGQSVVCLNWERRKRWRSASLENIVILNRQGLLLHKLIIRNHSKDK